MKILKWLFFKYQKMAWYINQAKGEYAKIGSFIPETLMIVTYLTIKGVDIKTWQIPLAYLVIMLAAILLGKFLAVIGVVKYNNQLGNAHNPEIMEILGKIKKIEEKL